MPRQKPKPDCVAAVKRGLEKYERAVDESDRKPSTKHTYITHARRFVGWLEGEDVLRRR